MIHCCSRGHLGGCGRGQRQRQLDGQHDGASEYLYPRRMFLVAAFFVVGAGKVRPTTTIKSIPTIRFRLSIGCDSTNKRDGDREFASKNGSHE